LSVPQYHNKVSIHWKVNLNKCDQKMKRTNSIMLIMALLAMFKIRSLQSQFKLWSLAFRLLFSISVLKNVLCIIFKFIPLNFKDFKDFMWKKTFCCIISPGRHPIFRNIQFLVKSCNKYLQVLASREVWRRFVQFRKVNMNKPGCVEMWL